MDPIRKRRLSPVTLYSNDVATIRKHMEDAGLVVHMVSEYASGPSLQDLRPRLGGQTSYLLIKGRDPKTDKTEIATEILSNRARVLLAHTKYAAIYDAIYYKLKGQRTLLGRAPIRTAAKIFIALCVIAPIAVLSLLDSVASIGREVIVLLPLVTCLVLFLALQAGKYSCVYTSSKNSVRGAWYRHKDTIIKIAIGVLLKWMWDTLSQII